MKMNKHEIEAIVREHVAKEIENAKKARVGRTEIFYDVELEKYAFKKTVINSASTLVYIGRDGVKRMLQERAKKLLGFPLSAKHLNEIIEYIPARMKIYDPHIEDEVFVAKGADIEYQNLCKLPEHYISAREVAKKHTKISADVALTKLKTQTPNTYLLLQNLIQKDEYIIYFLNWLAYAVQKLQKTRTAVVIAGKEQGTGKGVLWEQIISWIFGEQDNCVVVSNSDIKSSFNSVFENRLFVCFNEIKPDFNERTIVYETLKQYITDSTLTINTKMVRQYTVKNFFNCIFFSNHEVPLQVEGSDRRYTIFKTANTKLADIVGDTAKFIEKLRAERADFLLLLFRLQISEAQAQTPLETEQKKKIKELSNTKQDILKDIFIKRDLHRLQKLIDDLIEGRENEKEVEAHKKGQDPKFFAKTNAQYAREMLEFAKFGIFPTEILRWFYVIYVDDGVVTRAKVAKFWDSVLDATYRIGDKRTRVKALEGANAVLLDNKLYIFDGEKWHIASEDAEVAVKYIDADGNSSVDIYIGGAEGGGKVKEKEVVDAEKKDDEESIKERADEVMKMIFAELDDGDEEIPI